MILFLILLPIVTALVVALGCWLGWTGYAIALAIVFAVAVIWALASNIRSWWPHVGRHYHTFNTWVRNHGREILAFFSFLLTLGILVYAFNSCVWPKLKAEAARNPSSMCCGATAATQPVVPMATAPVGKTSITDLTVGTDTVWVGLNTVCRFNLKIAGDSATVITPDGVAHKWTTGEQLDIGRNWHKLGITTPRGTRIILTQTPPAEKLNEDCNQK